MNMLEVSLGTVIWTSIAFLTVLVILKKMAWKPILESLKEREQTIEEALKSAERAKAEMEALQAKNEELLKEARAQRDAMLKEAKETKERIVSEAKMQAKKEADAMIENARQSIEHEKQAALTELKNQVATLSIEIAEKILKTELSSEDKQKALVENYLNEVNLN
ncbi:MAG: F0F1 ATP synthase subunit B [Bacteroidetes bacterium]|nr:MAG: F0F1 ATP synthase subunit B [Bacteroidota bacterium]